MDYERVLEYLRKVEMKGPNLELTNTAKIFHHFPVDINPITFVQVAGTNGKGSTAHFLTSIFHAARLKTGLFISPHLHDVRERITVDHRWISEPDFADAVVTIKELSENLLKEKIIAQMPTYFEYTFLAAVYHFAVQKVNIAVLEVGLGGRLDATSVITPRVSVITGISHDHTGILGKRIKDIAFEKAGIIKTGVPVVSACSTHSPANTVIKEQARQLNAPFYNVFAPANKLEIEGPAEPGGSGYHCRYTSGNESFSFHVYLNGRHQPRNAATAIKTIQVLKSTGFKGGSLSHEAVREGIASTRIPARIEVLELDNHGPGRQTVILDGGHNIESIRALRNFLEERKKSNLTLIFGVLEDKDYKSMVRLILPFVNDVIVTDPLSPRALPAEKLVPLFSKPPRRNIQVKKDLNDAFTLAAERRNDILITGSFFLAGEMRHIIMKNCRPMANADGG
jgi:dihydrofolate synthase/folylpolyglutamate synthase